MDRPILFCPVQCVRLFPVDNIQYTHTDYTYIQPILQSRIDVLLALKTLKKHITKQTYDSDECNLYCEFILSTPEVPTPTHSSIVRLPRGVLTDSHNPKPDLIIRCRVYYTSQVYACSPSRSVYSMQLDLLLWYIHILYC